MKILVRDFNAKLERENIFKPTIENENRHHDTDDNSVRIVNYDTSMKLVAKSTKFLHRNIHKFTLTSPNGKTHKEIAHILIDRRWNSSILDVGSIRRAEYDIDH